MSGFPSHDMIAWEALREQQYSPREAARAADIVIQALRKHDRLKEPTACGCGPTLEQRADLKDKADREAFVAAMAADLANLDEMDRLAQGFDETEGSE